MDLAGAAVSDFDATALSPPAALAGNGPAKHTKSPAATINAERPLALIVIWQSPHLPAPNGEMRPCRVSAARQKKGIFGQHGAKAGQRAVFFAGRIFPGQGKAALRVRAGTIDGMSLPVSEPASRFRGGRFRAFDAGVSITTS
jgi:hypothetical protein